MSSAARRRAARRRRRQSFHAPGSGCKQHGTPAQHRHVQIRCDGYDALCRVLRNCVASRVVRVKPSILSYLIMHMYTYSTYIHRYTYTDTHTHYTYTYTYKCNMHMHMHMSRKHPRAPERPVNKPRAKQRQCATHTHAQADRAPRLCRVVFPSATVWSPPCLVRRYRVMLVNKLTTNAKEEERQCQCVPH